MEHFAALIDALVYTRSRNEKLRLIGEYLRATPDPDRGWALAALSDGLDFPAVKSSTIRTILKDRVDPVLWTLSRDFVGDTAETASLLWPQESTAPEDAPSPPSVSETVSLLQAMTRKSALTELPALLDRLDVSGRYALLKLTALPRHTPSCSPGRRTARTRQTWPTSRCSSRSCWRTRWRRRSSASTIMSPSGSGMGFACNWSMPDPRVAARPGSIRAGATIFRTPSPKCCPRSTFPQSSMANCWSRAPRKAERQAARPASTRSSNGWAARR